MCGICGLLVPSGRPDPALVERMCDALRHRGPDEGGVDDLGRCILGPRRLQGIDLAAAQPPGASRDLGPAAVDAYLALQHAPSGPAPGGVGKLPPGHFLVAENGNITVEPYWSLEPKEYEGDWLELVRSTVGSAVRKRLVAD